MVDTATGAVLARAAVDAIVVPRCSTLGIDGDRGWVFERVRASTSELADRPARIPYEVHSLDGAAVVTPPLDAGVWSGHGHAGGPGVAAIANTAGGVALIARHQP